MNVLIRSSSGITQVPLESRLMSERKIFIEGEIEAGMALEFMKKIMYLNSENDDAPIAVCINSPGGEINSGMLMYDTIIGSKAPIRMYCTGRAYSMGAILLVCAKERFVLPNSEIMIHQPLLGGCVNGNANSIQSISDSLLEIKKKMNKILSKHTGKTEQEIDEATRYDHYFAPEEAVAFGLCDEIVSFHKMMEG